MEIPGVGPLIATAAVATMGEASAFKSGREFAAYVGLVPKQTGSGGKVCLPGISKRGDTYLWTLFIHGARTAALLSKEPGLWITELKKTASDQCGYRGDGKQAGADGMGNSRPCG